MKLVNRSRKGKIIKVIKEINTINELEKYIKEPKINFNRTIKDFIKFSNDDYEYLLNLLNVDKYYSQSQLMWNCLSKNIFKYHYKSQRKYWLCRGWNEEETTLNVSEYQKIASKAMKEKIKNSPNYYSLFSMRPEYWIKKGFSETEAIEKVKERQTTFTLAKCILKYGEEKGKKRFKDRQTKWINSLYNGKTDDEIIAFEKSKMIDFCKASTKSLKIFLPLVDYIKKDGIVNDKVKYYLGYEDTKEFFLYNKENQILFFYDFVIPKLKIIIEFNGRVWHPNGDDWKPLSMVTETIEQITYKEKLKESTAIQNGFKLLKIWDNDSNKENLQKCIEFINLNK